VLGEDFDQFGHWREDLPWGLGKRKEGLLF
jgi:hypothetical protein